MAVDSQPRRFSMLNFAQLGALLPAPDGTLGAPDRIHLLGFYSGLQAAEDQRGLNVAVATRAHMGITAGDRFHVNIAANNRPHMTVVAGDRQG